MQDGMESDKEFLVPTPDVSQVNETVIKFMYQGDASAWKSESDSDTSMPDFKRGKHADTHEDSPETTSKTDTPQASTGVISADVRKHKASENS